MGSPQLLKNSKLFFILAAVLTSLTFINRRSAREIIPKSALEISVAISRLQILLSPEGIALIFACFIVNKRKRQSALCGANLACLMQFKAFPQIVRAADIEPLIGFRLQHINVMHRLFHRPSSSPMEAVCWSPMMMPAWWRSCRRNSECSRQKSDAL